MAILEQHVLLTTTWHYLQRIAIFIIEEFQKASMFWYHRIWGWHFLMKQHLEDVTYECVLSHY